MKKAFRHCLLAVCGLFVFAMGCQTAAPQKPTTRELLKKTSWVCNPDSLQGVKPGRGPLHKPDRNIDLSFNETLTRAVGCGGVNRYFGGVIVPAEGVVKFDISGATMMMGPGMPYERAYLEMLRIADAYILEGDKLILLSKKKPVAEFKKVPFIQ